MARQPVSITLGGEDYSIRPTTVRQLSQIEKVITGKMSNIEQARGVIIAALERDHPKAAEDIDNMEISFGEAATAMAVIMRHGGFIIDLPKLVEKADGAPAAAG